MNDKLLISVNEFCRMTSISRALYFEKRACGRIGPQEIRIGRKILLRADEVRDWVGSGCPPRRLWKWRGGAR